MQAMFDFKMQAGFNWETLGKKSSTSTPLMICQFASPPAAGDKNRQKITR